MGKLRFEHQWIGCIGDAVHVLPPGHVGEYSDAFCAARVADRYAVEIHESPPLLVDNQPVVVAQEAESMAPRRGRRPRGS